MSRSTLLLTLATLAGFGGGCSPPDGTGDSAMIEITGYLDEDQVVVTAKSQPSADTTVEVTVLGEPGAAVVPGTITVGVVRTGDSASSTATDDGAFVVEGLEVLLGDVLEVGHSEAGEGAVEVVAEALDEFPALTEVHWGAWHEHEILLTVLLEEALPHGTSLVASNLTDHHVGSLEAVGEREHQGWVVAAPEHWILLYGVDAEHHATVAVELQAPGAEHTSE